jgi:hypothetical protein
LTTSGASRLTINQLQILTGMKIDDYGNAGLNSSV